jgi:23S rRNA (pseudouridine1915-N3)-methyltransferase
MKIIIIAIGKEKDFSGQDNVREYTDRISHYCPCEWKYIAGNSFDEDNAKLVAAIDVEKEKTGAYIIALDEKGKEYDSRAFADRIQSCMNESIRTLMFVIGGSYGLNDEVRQRANITVALSKLTFPHQLVRLIIAEQIYRAFTIIRGEKYHH